MLVTYCLYSPSGNKIAAPYVFPATGNAIGCSFVDALRPVNGNLFFLDSSYNCDSPSVAGWQRPTCHAFQTYGAYQHDTGGYNGDGIEISHNGHEGPDAYAFAGLTEPALNWFRSFTNYSGGASPSGGWTGQNGLRVYTDSGGNVTEVIAPFFNLPGALSHMHIVDPCIAIGNAGLSSYGGVTACH
jgi:hypothetical protein